MIKLRFTMMGRSYDVANKLPDEIELADDARIDAALQSVAGLLSTGQELPPSCLVVHNGTHLGTVAKYDNVPLADQDDLVLIAPVAGG